MEDRRFDVVSVSIETKKIVAIFAENKTEKDAEAVVKMAVMRRGVETEFYADVPAGKYKEGDAYAG